MPLTLSGRTYIALAEATDSTLLTTDRTFDTASLRRIIDVHVVGRQ